jgi:hypothetical protein
MSTIHILHYGEREVIQLLVLILLSRFKYLMYICQTAMLMIEDISWDLFVPLILFG